MHLLRLIKINSAKISALSLINLVGMSVFCVALFDCSLISFRISTFSTNKKLKIRFGSIQFSLMDGWMSPILHDNVNDCITDIFRCLVNLIKLWNVNIGYCIRKEFIQNFGSFFINLIILSPSTIVVFSFEIILFDNNGLITLQNISL